MLKYFKFSSKPIHGLDILKNRSLIAMGDDSGSFKCHDFAADIELLTIPNLHTDFLRKITFVPHSETQILTMGLDSQISRIDLLNKQHEFIINN